MKRATPITPVMGKLDEEILQSLYPDIIIEPFHRKVTDGSILRLLRLFLESGVMIGEAYESTPVGSPQGGVISPLIANVYLDRVDQFMRGRGHRRLKQLGYRPPFKAIRMVGWHNANSPLASYAIPNSWLHDDMGLVDRASTEVGITVSVI